MKPDGVKGQTPVESVKVQKQQKVFETVDNADKLSKALAGLETDINQSIEDAVNDKDKVISGDEYKELSGLQLLASRYIEKASKFSRDLIEKCTKLYGKIASVFMNNEISDEAKELRAQEFEPQETDAETQKAQAKYYAEDFAQTISGADELLKNIIHGKNTRAADQNSKYNHIAYRGQTPKEYGLERMKEIAKHFLSAPHDIRYNARCLMWWAENQNKRNDMQPGFSDNKNISFEERNLLIRYAEKAIEKADKALSREINHKASSQTTVAESNGDEEAWAEYAKAMHELSQGRLFEDLPVISGKYTEECVQNILNSVTAE